MNKILRTAVLSASLTIALISCDKDDDYEDGYNPPASDVALSQSVGDSAQVINTINQFRTLTGDVLNTAPGAVGGRREINWDGVPDNSAADFFNLTADEAPNGRKRGLVYFPADVLLRTSTDNFAGIEPTYANQFKPFSKPKLFSVNGTNITEIRFKVPGTNQDAFVKSFGAIFSDVDDANATTIEIFNGDKKLALGKAKAGNGLFSFLGLSTNKEMITRVRITTGNAALAAGVKDVTDGGSKDLVVMDDFIYSEPVAIP